MTVSFHPMGILLRSAPRLAMPACDARSAQGIFRRTRRREKRIKLYSWLASRELGETLFLADKTYTRRTSEQAQ